MGDAGLTADDGSLAPDLVASLHPKLRDALNHPTRRDVLRALHGKKRTRSVAEIVDRLPPLKRAAVSYHAQVLRDSDCIEERGTRPGGGRERLFGSEIAGDRQARLVLEATERVDREHRRRLEPRVSLGALAMFRLPRPAITIRLSGGHRTLGQNQ